MSNRKVLLAVILLGCLAAFTLTLVACGEPKIGMPATYTPTPTNCPNPTDSPTPTESPTPTDSPTPTMSPTPTDSPTPTATPTDTPTPTPTATPLPPGSTPWNYDDVDISWIDPSKPMIALTIDDGPAAGTSDAILDTLEKYGAHCTFFWVGDRVQTYKSRAERAIALGCEVGNHTFEHKFLHKLTNTEIDYQITQGVKALNQLTGWNRSAYIFRCPGGMVTDYVKSVVNAPIMYWSVDTRDWESRDCDKVVAKVIGKVKDGDIILCHELYQSTADALAIIIPKLQAEGYQIVSVSEMFKAKGMVMLNGHQYTYAR